MERVSQRRLDFLKQAYRQVGMSGIDALHRAQLTYAAYVGFLASSCLAARREAHRSD